MAVTEPLLILLPAQTVRKMPHSHCPGAQVPSPRPRLRVLARAGVEAPTPGRFVAALTPVQEAAGGRGRVPAWSCQGRSCWGCFWLPSQGSHELGRNGLCSQRALREEEL